MVYERMLVCTEHHHYCPCKENFRAQLTIFTSVPTSFGVPQALVIPANEPSNTLASQLLFLIFRGLSFSFHCLPWSHPGPSHFLRQCLLQIANSQVICEYFSGAPPPFLFYLIGSRTPTTLLFHPRWASIPLTPKLPLFLFSTVTSLCSITDDFKVISIS